MKIQRYKLWADSISDSIEMDKSQDINDWCRGGDVAKLEGENAELQKIIDLSKKQMDKLEAENEKYRNVIKISYILISTFNKRYKDRKMLRTERIEEILSKALEE